MPIVPIFQGGVPQVGASRTPTTPLRVPSPSVDYARVMQAALEPLKVGVDAAAKLQRQEEARQIKALSDEAETAYMNSVNARMIDPETGYLNQRGKTASENYKATVDGLRGDADKIIGGLAPYVRQAVESRIEDRFLAAQSQAMRWNAQQTQAWHLESSQARIDALTNDAAQHYGDENYLAKSWLSLAQEVEYQGRLRGWDADTQKQQMAAHYDAFMANRFSTWALDDAVGAFEAAQSEREHMSADVWGKLDAGLWNSSKSVLAYRLAQAAPFIRRSQERYEQPDFSDRFNTKLSDEDEEAFQAWAKENHREKDVYDYDLRGAWKELQSGSMSEDQRGHLGDKYKKPNHPTFSSESIYSNGDGGRWSVDASGANVFTPGRKLSEAEADYLREYFARVEPGVVLNLSGRIDRSSASDATLDPTKPTGIPAIDGLSFSRKLELFSSAKGFMQRSSAERKSSLKREVANSLQLASQEGADPNPLSRDQFVEAYGEEDGDLRYRDYVSDLGMREKVYSFTGLSNADIAASLEAMRPQRGSETYATESENFERAQRAAQIIFESRGKDPVGAALQDPKYGFSPITDWTNASVGQELARRQAEVEQVAADYGTVPALLSDDEAASFVQTLDSQDPDKQAQTLESIAKSLGDDGAISTLGAQLGKKNARYATACFLMSENSALGPMYLKGRQFMEEKRVQAPANGEGSLGGFYEILGDEEGTLGVTSDRRVLSTLADASQGLWAYGQVQSGAGLDTAEAAVQQAVGRVESWNGKKIIMPKRGSGRSYEASSWLAYDFEDLITATQKRLSSQKGKVVVEGYEMPMSTFASRLPGLQLQSVGDGTYFVLDGKTGYVLNRDGTPYVLNVIQGERK